jgi:hypothetical protein
VDIYVRQCVAFGFGVSGRFAPIIGVHPARAVTEVTQTWNTAAQGANGSVREGISKERAEPGETVPGGAVFPGGILG